MHKIDKFLAKLEEKQRGRILLIIAQIKSRNFVGLDLKKLKGGLDIYRVRSGQYRILFHLTNDDIFLLDVTNRDDTTYHL
ncbi:MAG: hypothetical protein AAB391_02620 [Patescibacteria group bacterium]